MDAYIEVNYQSKGLKANPLFGHVDFSDNIVDPTTSTISMRAEIPNPKRAIFPGTFVYVNIFVTDRIKFMGVPPQVIFEDQNGYYLYKVDSEDRAQRVYIEPVFESRFFSLFKEGSLKSGDKVIVNALMRLKPGLSVAPEDVTDFKGIDAVIRLNNLIPNVSKEKE